MASGELSILNGDQAGRSVPLGDRLTIGRAADNDLVVDDPNVSRHHAVLERLENGELQIRDLGSANGTFVDGRRIDRGAVRGGRQLQVGDTVMCLPEGGARAAVSPEGRPTDSAIRRALRNSVILQTIAPELRRNRQVTLAAVAVAAAALLALSSVLLLGGRNEVQDAVAIAEPSTVLVVPERDGQPHGNGSGWVLDARNGLVVTNAHVVNGGETFKVSVGEQLVPARVVAVAPCDDLAVLRVPPSPELRSIKLGSQSALALGDTVVAVGYPQSASAGVELTSTAGVVSRVRTTYEEDGLDVPQYRNVIQTDAAINPGNSGGPLVDLDGRLVGVNAADRTTAPSGRVVQGQGYAVGVDRVREVLPGLRAGRSTAWIGAGFRYPPLDKLAEQRLPAGIYIDGAVKGSTAARAGLGAESALLVAVNGRPVSNTLAGWCAATRGIAGGSAATLQVIRPGRRSPERVRVRFM